MSIKIDGPVSGSFTPNETMKTYRKAPPASAVIALKMINTIGFRKGISAVEQHGNEPDPKPQPKAKVRAVSLPKVGRNDNCPCGSGKKFKKCCMFKKEETDGSGT